jgi:hypothetical protein
VLSVKRTILGRCFSLSILLVAVLHLFMEDTVAWWWPPLFDSSELWYYGYDERTRKCRQFPCSMVL